MLKDSFKRLVRNYQAGGGGRVGGGDFKMSAKNDVTLPSNRNKIF